MPLGLCCTAAAVCVFSAPEKVYREMFISYLREGP